jgi:four helix bundle protein
VSAFRTFEEMTAWQKSRELTREVYRVTGRGRFGRDFALVDQMRRAAVSVMSSIAEGFERRGRREFAQFLSVAKGSLGEVRAQLYVASDQGYIDATAFKDLYGLTIETGRLLGGLARYLRNKEAMNDEKKAGGISG